MYRLSIRAFNICAHKTVRSMSLITPLETHQYAKGKLSKTDVASNPACQFRTWFQQALDAKIELPEAMNLATAELPSGKVSLRTVLLKEVDSDGNIIIYSNWQHSRKASDFKTNPNVALNFWWKELERCIRIEGKASRMSREESELYYQTRPRGSQIGAWASQQSQPIDSREKLEEIYRQTEQRFEGQEKLPCPPFWGGIRVVPEKWEFWQGRNSRIHDRIEYTKTGDDQWDIQRLNP